MKKRRKTILLTGLIMTLSIVTATVFAQENFVHENVEKLWTSDQVFKVPESVYFDADRDVLYVANINGRSTAVDGNGFISKLSPSGEVIELKWVEGLNAPKGMGVYNGALYVTDINRVVKIDIESGAVLETFNAPEAEFLNDIAVDEMGIVYVSDMRTNEIYRVKEGTIKKWIELFDYKGPNGLYSREGRLFIGVNNYIVSVDLNSGDMMRFVSNTGGIDGLEGAYSNYFLISDWSGKVHVVHPKENKTLIIDTTPGNINAADIEYDPEKQILYVPTFNDHRIEAYSLKNYFP